MKYLCVSVLFLAALIATPLARAQSLDVLVEGVVGDNAPSSGIYLLHDVDIVLPEGMVLVTVAGGTVTVSLGQETEVLDQEGESLGLEDIQGGMAVRVAGSLLDERIFGRLVAVLEQ